MAKWSQAYEGARKYSKEWENQFKWLSFRGNAYYCKVCNVEINSFEKSVLVQHEQSVKHRENSDAIPTRGLSKFFKPSASNTSLKEFEIKYSMSRKHSFRRSSLKTMVKRAHWKMLDCTKLYVVARAFFEELVDELKWSKFSLMIDESIHGVDRTQKFIFVQRRKFGNGKEKKAFTDTNMFEVRTYVLDVLGCSVFIVYFMTHSITFFFSKIA